MENVKAAEQAKLYDVAEQELLAYFKRTRSAKEPVKTLSAQMRLHADDALRHYFRGNKDVHPPVFRGAKIDWTGRAFVDGQEIHDTYRTDSLGVLTFDKSGNHELAVKPKAHAEMELHRFEIYHPQTRRIAADFQSLELLVGMTSDDWH